MYSVSEAYLDKLHSPVHTTSLSGTIGSTAFTDADVLDLTITNQCSNTNEVTLGSVYTGELKMTLRYDFPISRYSWRNSAVTVSEGLKINNSITEYVPLGVFIISECTFSLSGIDITAYDAMIKFDKSFSGTLDGSPYSILQKACEKCSVVMKTTEGEIENMPNGTANLTMYANNDIETYRDLVSWVAATLCGFATIDRDGKLEIRKYNYYPADTLTNTMRFNTCSFAGYDISYTGLSVVSEADQSTRYFHVTPDNGSVYNMGPNPFLQGEGVMAQNLINAFSQIELTPFKASILNGALYDLGDCIRFTGGIAGNVKCGIMKYSYVYNGGYTMEGFGKDPALASAKSKTDKNLSGLYSAVAKEVNQMTVIGNPESVSIAEDTEVNLLTYNFEVIEDNNLTFTEFAVIMTSEAVETEEDDVYSFADIVAALKIYVDGTALNGAALNGTTLNGSEPVFIVDEGKDTLVFTGRLQGLSQGPHELQVRINLSGGTGSIDSGDVTGNLFGYGITFEVYVKALQSAEYRDTYYIGEDFNLDGIRTELYFNNGTRREVTEDCVYYPETGTILSEPGPFTVGVSYTDPVSGETYNTEYDSFVSEELFRVFMNEDTVIDYIAASYERNINLYTGVLNGIIVEVSVEDPRELTNDSTNCYLSIAKLHKSSASQSYVVPNLEWRVRGETMRVGASKRYPRICNYKDYLLICRSDDIGGTTILYSKLSGSMSRLDTWLTQNTIYNYMSDLDILSFTLDNITMPADKDTAQDYSIEIECSYADLTENVYYTPGIPTKIKDHADHSRIMVIGDYVIFPRVEMRYYIKDSGGTVYWNNENEKFGFAYMTVSKVSGEEEVYDHYEEIIFGADAHYVKDLYGTVYNAEALYERTLSEPFLGVNENESFEYSKSNVSKTYKIEDGEISIYELGFNETDYFTETLLVTEETGITSVTRSGRISGSRIFYVIGDEDNVIGFFDETYNRYEEYEWASENDDLYKYTVSHIRKILYHPNQHVYFYAYTELKNNQYAQMLAYIGDIFDGNPEWEIVEGNVGSTIPAPMHFKYCNLFPYKDASGDYIISGAYRDLTEEEITEEETKAYHPSLIKMLGNAGNIYETY